MSSAALAVLAGTALANPKVDTVALHPTVPVSARWLNWYQEEEGAVVMAASTLAWTATRSEVLLVFESETSGYWSNAVGYRRDRAEGVHDTIVGGSYTYSVQDLVDPSLPPLIVGPTAGERAYDVDGDGTVDLLSNTLDQLLLMSWSGPRAVPLPSVIDPIEFYSLPHPMPDLNGDGHAEVFHSVREPAAVYEWVEGSTLFLYDGSLDGYDATPRWALPTDGVPVDAIALQADEDPELEILALVVDLYVDFGWGKQNHVRTVLIDDAHTASPTLTVNPGQWAVWDINSLSPLANLGDLDGDGLDEVLLTGRRPRDYIDLHILGSTAGYDLDAPLTSLGMQGVSRVRSMPVDIDGDGHIDVVAMDEDIFDPFIQVWFGPFVDPIEPEPSHTGDTATPADTGSTAATADTDTADTGAPLDSAADTPPATPPPDDTGCGCQSHPGAPWLAGLRWGARRR